MTTEAYLQHGEAGSPMRTERVERRLEPLPFHKRGQTGTATGYGARIPSVWMVKVEGRWRRVYCYVYSNAGTLYIGKSLKAGTIVSLY